MTYPIAVAPAMSPSWYEARKHSVGASEIAAAAGMNPWMTPLELYLQKRGEIPPFEGNDFTRMGKLLEPVVKQEFCRIAEVELLDDNPPMFRHPKYDCITATPDGIITPQRLLEAKASSWRMKAEWGEQGTDDTPTQYLLQCQAQMAVMGADEVDLAVLFDGADLKLFKVLRNDQLIELLIGAALTLWERIQNGNPPEPEWKHPSTLRLVKEMHSTISDTRIMLNDDEARLWIGYEDHGRIKAYHEKKQDELKAMILHAIGDHYAGILPDGRMIRRKMIHKDSYTVKAVDYCDTRATKQDNGLIVDRNFTITEKE